MEFLRDLVFGISLSGCILLWRLFLRWVIMFSGLSQRSRQAGVRVAFGEWGSMTLLFGVCLFLLIPMLTWSMSDRTEWFTWLPFILGFVIGLIPISWLMQFAHDVESSIRAKLNRKSK